LVCIIDSSGCSKKSSSTHSILLQDREVDGLAEDATGDDDGFFSHSNADQTTLIDRTLSQAIRLATVDNFQSEEAKLFIVSPVRSNLKNNTEFLKTPDGINVLVGNMITTEPVPTWRDVIKFLRQAGNLGDALELCCPRH
jgi:hypothetical protein